MNLNQCEVSLARATLTSQPGRELARVLATEMLGLGFSRATVARISVDRKALVVVAAESMANKPACGTRLKLIASGFWRKTSEHKGALMYLASDRSSYGSDPWQVDLYREGCRYWIETAIVDGDTLLGALFLDNGSTAVLPSDLGDLLSQIDRIVSVYSKYLVPSLRRASAERLAAGYEELLVFDSSVVDELEIVLDRKTPDFNPVLERLATVISGITSASCVDISVKEDGVYKPLVRQGEVRIGVEALEDDPIASDSVSVRAMQSGEVRYFIGKRSDDLYSLLSAQALTSREVQVVQSLRSWGAFPLNVGSRTIGALSVASMDWDFFTESHKGILHEAAELASLVLTLADVIRQHFVTVEEQSRNIRSLSMRLTDLTRTAAFESAARTVIHNLGNLMTPVGNDLGKITKWSEKYKGSFPRKALEDLQNRLESVEDVFKLYRRLKSHKKVLKIHNVNDLIDEAVEFCLPRTQAFSVPLQVNQADRVLGVKCSDVDMIHAFINVILNALEAVSEKASRGGAISIRTMSVGNNCVVKVDDDGVGFSNRDAEKLFEVDYTTKINGTGLGLNHVRRAVQDVGGRVELRGMRLKGATVTITLPLEDGG